MFLHSFKNTFKVLIRQKELIFWSLIFPVLLGFLFKLALGGIGSDGNFETIPISVDQSILDDETYSQFLDSMVEQEMFDVISENSDQALKNEEVVAHIASKDQVITRGSGIEESIIESILNSYAHNEATIVRIVSENPQADISEILEVDNYIQDNTNENMNQVYTYFYTLLGMQALYGYMWGMQVMYYYEANLSTHAMRNAVAPVNKKTSMFASLLVAWIMSMLVMIVNLLIMRYVLNVEFGNRLLPVLGVVSLGALTGVSMGALIAVSNKKDVEFKIGIGISTSMLLSFLAGMMVAEIKVIIQRFAPIINKLNPVALITDSIYSLYYYDSLSRYANNMIILLAITGLIIFVTLILIRGKKYDNL